MSPKAKTQPVGSTWDLGEGEHLVVRPDGEQVTVTGLYVLTQPGTYRSGDDEIEAKEAKS